jgi:DNA-binding transcriptional MerR regulator
MKHEKPTLAERLAVAEWLNTSDLALLYRIPESTWRTWAAAGTGPPSRRPGKRRIYKRSDVEQWLEAQNGASA